MRGEFFYNLNLKNLRDQLTSQRSQVSHLLRNRPQIPAYRHVAIVPEDPRTDIGADAALTWDDMEVLTGNVLGVDHYVTIRLRNAVTMYKERGDPSILNYDGILSFNEMREKCRLAPEEIQVGLVGGERALRKLSLVKAEERHWKWRDSKNKGHIDRTNWLVGGRWLEIVESRHGFGAEADQSTDLRQND